MAEQKFSARVRAAAGTPNSGVTHVRTRLDADFTVIANALAQRRGSAVTVGVAAYILSLPDGASVTIAALCAHFSEGEILISRALRELEDAGYLERVRVRDARGAIRTETYFHDVPEGGVPFGPPEPPESPQPPELPETPEPDGPGPRVSAVRPAPPRNPEAAGSVPAAVPAPAEEEAAAHADPRAVALLASLRTADPRLVLSRREAAALAPAVGQWLAAGVEPAQLTQLLTVRLPEQFVARPARILAYRLKEPPLPAPAPPPPPPPVLPWQNCDGGCNRVFRAAHPGTCRDCRDGGAGAA
jgi:hypothetical protein